MPEDASLDDFLDADDDREATQSQSTGDDEAVGDGADGADGGAGERDGKGETAGEGERGGETETAAEREDEGGDGALSPSAVDDAVSTYAWSPDGATCEACGEGAERRWRDDAGLVCAACKEW